MEFLSQLIQKKIITKQWHPFRFRNKETHISNLLFADDILLFAKANTANILSINDVLSIICKTTGMTINLEKSRVWFSKTVSVDSINHFQSNLGIRRTTDLGFYLGYPLETSYKKSDFNFILGKINTKLQGRKTKFALKVGRTQLINSTLSNLSGHLMKAFLLPKQILEKIDKQTINFFWGHTNTTNKIHTLNWDIITKPKPMGGLGIRKAEHINKTHLLIMLWRFFNSKDRIWTQILLNKYANSWSSNSVNKSHTFKIFQKKKLPTLHVMYKIHHW